MNPWIMNFCALPLADFMSLVSIFRTGGNRAASKGLKLLLLHQWNGCDGNQLIIPSESPSNGVYFVADWLFSLRD